jgi:hypothetical protein
MTKQYRCKGIRIVYLLLIFYTASKFVSQIVYLGIQIVHLYKMIKNQPVMKISIIQVYKLYTLAE